MWLTFNIPEYAWSRLWVPKTLGTSGLALTVISFLVMSFEVRVDGITGFLFVLSFACWMIGVLWDAFVTARIRRELTDLAFLACRRCAYSLRGLEGRASCPECGLSQYPAISADEWENWVRMNRPIIRR